MPTLSLSRRNTFTILYVLAAGISLSITSGCQMMKSHADKKQIVAAVPVAPPLPGDPQATYQFTVAPDDDVVGVMQVTHSSAEDTFSDIARRFNLGFDEIVRANPHVDPWLPGANTEIVLPTQFVLPDAPREGLVINLPELRVFYYPKPRKGEPQTVITHPIGIGKVGWATPEGSTKITGKRKNPIWTPPVSVRKEHKENGDPLPRQVPAGPDNPLGAFAMTLGWPSYLVHGTNKPYGVGMRASHGCIRFYPEDIALLFEQIPVGTNVHVVNQPLLIGWNKDALYVQALPPLETEKNADDEKKADDKTVNSKTKKSKDDRQVHNSQSTNPNASEPLVASEAASKVLNVAISDRLWHKAQAHAAQINLAAVNTVVTERRGITTPVSESDLSPAQFLANVPRVYNELPRGATWNGKEELLISAEEYEAVRDGKPLPKRSKRTSKSASKVDQTRATPIADNKVAKRAQ